MIDFGHAGDMRWVGEAKEVQFSVEVGNRDILCRVSQEAIGNHLSRARGAQRNTWMRPRRALPVLLTG